MPKGYFYTSISFIVFKKQMSQAANTDLLNPYVPKAHNSEWQNPLFPLQINPIVPDAHYSERQDNHFLYRFND